MFDTPYRSIYGCSFRLYVNLHVTSMQSVKYGQAHSADTER